MKKINLEKEKKIILILLLCITCLEIIDFILDIKSDWPLKAILADLFFEMTIFILILIVTILFYRLYLKEKSKYVIIRSHFEEEVKKNELLKKKLNDITRDLQCLILDQFNRWKLSKSEKEVAFLIIKGKNFKEIALLRFTSEKTVRNQCQSIYEKSGLKGRNEFSAFFLNKFFGDFQS